MRAEDDWISLPASLAKELQIAGEMISSLGTRDDSLGRSHGSSLANLYRFLYDFSLLGLIFPSERVEYNPGRRAVKTWPRRATPRRAFLATLTLAGLRISEALDLRWRDVDLPAGRLRITDAKTDAGVRLVDLLPAVREELPVHKTETWFGDPEDFVFPTGSGRRQDRNNARRRVVVKSVARASENLIGQGLNPLPEGTAGHRHWVSDWASGPKARGATLTQCF
jgi:integrase